MARYCILRPCILRCALLVIMVRAEEVFNTTPPAIKTSFSCFNRPMGFYADVEANCRVYHMCDDHGNKFSYRCPEETAFRQDALICDHAHLVDCQATVYPTSTRPPNEKYVDNAQASSSIKSPSGPVDDHQLSFSRSFQVLQRPKSVAKSGFVFSANLFLKDQDQARHRAEQITARPAKMCNTGPKHRLPIARTLVEPWRACNDKPDPTETSPLISDKRRSFERPVANPWPPAPNISQYSFLPLRDKSPSVNYGADYRPYSETLRSIQTHARNAKDEAAPTTEIPVHALTLSLKPLVPNELEHDPYYPKHSATSTEAYYTPSHRAKVNAQGPFGQPLSVVARPSALPFRIPSVLPDLNSLEDLVDRRKFFYIPRE